MSRAGQITAIVPLSRFEDAKTRLSAVLSAPQRAALAEAMARDVLATLKAAQTIDQILVVSQDPTAALLAEEYGCDLACSSEDRDLNSALEYAANQAERAGARAIVILPADLPLLTAEALDRFIEKCASHIGNQPVVGLQSCGHGDGTNLFFSELSVPIDFQYGPGSFERHANAAKRAGLLLLSETARETFWDLDTREDLERIQAALKSGTYDARFTFAFFKTPTPVNGNSTLSMKSDLDLMIERTVGGDRLSDDQAKSLATYDDVAKLMQTASQIRDKSFGPLITYSRKVFLPLTRLCRDVCHYCTFAVSPREVSSPYLSADEVVETAKRGAELGCKEALLTLGEKPELRYAAARDALKELGFATTLEYVTHVAERVMKETGLLPHINAGNMTADEIAELRKVSASMGLMIENTSPRLCEKGGPHYGSPDKDPAERLETLRLAGEAGVPFTTGILIGIGETRLERIESLLAIRDLHDRYGHIQEVIVQNFVPKPDTKMRDVPAADLTDLLWTIAMARIILDPSISIQAPPNLNMQGMRELVAAGLNDWGGVSPLTPDYVNPEKPWPHVDQLAEETDRAGFHLKERLTLYPAYVQNAEKWLDPKVDTYVMRFADGGGLGREDEWLTGVSENVPDAMQALTSSLPHPERVSSQVKTLLAELEADGATNIPVVELGALFGAHGADYQAICSLADRKRTEQAGETVTFVVNRNINYTNICGYKCQFCAFSKGKTAEHLRGKPYNLAHEEVQARSIEAWEKGATEVCLQGGIHPDYTGQTYLDICGAIRDVLPDMHIHAFSPLEVFHGATSLNMPIADFLKELKAAGLNSLPGTAAEILHDDVREIICKDKINTRQWLEVIESAHEVGLPTTSTIMFGHIDTYEHWAHHLLELLALQTRTGGLTEFVPLPFVAQESPMYLKGRARLGPTFRESVLIHAVARLVLGPKITNIQTSWVKMGREGAQICLKSGVNDLGGTLMDESITRAAGASHGQEVDASEMFSIIGAIGRPAQQRTTLYQPIVGTDHGSIAQAAAFVPL